MLRRCGIKAHNLGLLQNLWAAISFSTLARFRAGISIHATIMHPIPSRKRPHSGIAAHPPRALQEAHFWTNHHTFYERMFKGNTGLNKLIVKIRDHFLRDILNRLSDVETGIHVLVHTPLYDHSQEKGFNGLGGRKSIFCDLLKNFNFSKIIETGTYLGDTTGYMATVSNVPIRSCEKNTHLFELAKSRLKDKKNVDIFNMDSRKFLHKLKKDSDLIQDRCFFYLDAHWGKDVPLKEEIETIASCWDSYIIMIDDFKVPDDDGYLYGSYGTLEAIGIEDLHRKYGLASFFPVLKSADEDQPSIGCTVLLSKKLAEIAPARIKSLRKF